MIKRDIETLDKINYGGIMFEQGRKEREAEILEIINKLQEDENGCAKSCNEFEELIKQIKEQKEQ